MLVFKLRSQALKLQFLQLIAYKTCFNGYPINKEPHDTEGPGYLLRTSKTEHKMTASFWHPLLHLFISKCNFFPSDSACDTASISQPQLNKGKLWNFNVACAPPAPPPPFPLPLAFPLLEPHPRCSRLLCKQHLCARRCLKKWMVGLLMPDWIPAHGSQHELSPIHLFQPRRHHKHRPADSASGTENVWCTT